MELLSRIASAAGDLAPLPLGTPFAPAGHIQALVAHLTSAKVHDVYFPFVRFGAIHAARCTLGWAAMTKARRGRASLLQDWIGYLTIAWGGGTLASLLVSTPPAWLLSPTPWVVYSAIYLLLVPTGLAAFFVSTAPALPLGLMLAALDGLLRGVSICAMPSLIANSGRPALAALSGAAAWWVPAVLGAIATNGGGWIAQTLGMAQATWTPGRPAVLDGGVLGTLDVWGAIVGSIAYSALTGVGGLTCLGDFLAARIPAELHTTTGEKTADAASSALVIAPDTARAVTVLLLGCLSAARAITATAAAWRKRTPTAPHRADTPPIGEKTTEVVKSPASVSEGVTTPKQRKRKGKKSKTQDL